MLTIEPLKNHPQAIPALARLWHQALGARWMPELELSYLQELYEQEIAASTVLPLTHVAFLEGVPVGSCTLEHEGGIRPTLQPWLGDLVVEKSYQGQQIGSKLARHAQRKAAELGFEKIYLFTFDKDIPQFYERLGWTTIGTDFFHNHEVIVMELCLKSEQASLKA